MKSRASVITLEDVAKRARVHPSTVSRFFSKPAVVAPKTAERIRQASEALGYVPDLLAGSLAANRRRLVTLLVRDLAYANFNEAIEEISSGLTQAGINVMLGIVGNSMERYEQLATAALSWRVDAVIDWTLAPPANAQRLRDRGMTVLQICDASFRPVDIGLGFNEVKAGQALAEFVWRKGRRHPFLVATRGPYSILRHGAFRARWRELSGAECPDLLIDTPANFHQGRAVFKALSELAQRPDIVIAPSDTLAQALIIEAMAQGIAVPGALAVIGFGNTPLASDMRPSITSVDLHSNRIAAEALRVLDARARGEAVPEHHIDLGFEIVERESC